MSQGHHVLIHGRNQQKLDAVEKELSALGGNGQVESYCADLSNLKEVDALAKAVASKHKKLDVLINNAGILKTPETITADGIDIRFMVNTIAPYRLTQQLLPLVGSSGRVLNLSSAAQAPVDLQALRGEKQLDDMAAYAQSKLAITMWTRALAAQDGAPMMVAINPGSLLGSKMVKEFFGTEGKDIGIGASILCRAALDDEFSNATGRYFDNDSGQFADPHGDALNESKSAATVEAIEEVLTQLTG